MLLRVYKDPDLVRAIAEDYEHADIPELHKLVYRWTGKLVKAPWEVGSDDIAMLRGAGISDAEITEWGVTASIQSWYSMSADGAGVASEWTRTVGSTVGWEIKVQEDNSNPATSTNEKPLASGSSERRSEIAWVETKESGHNYSCVEQAALERWGTMPVLLRAISALPESLEMYAYMLQLLEQPQSEGLSPRTHALVRAEVANTNRSTWAKATIDTLLAKHTGPLKDTGAVDEFDLMATNLAKKLVLTPWKMMGKEVEAFRARGLGDEVYLDVLNTTAIQNALDRLSWALGVPDDTVPLLADRN